MTAAAATSSNVLRRFLARRLVADERFRPPKSIVNAVETGVLDSHVLLFWKDVVEKISAGPGGWKDSSYGAAISYWRNKCAKNGYPLPREYMEGLGGKGSQGRWSIKTGDDIEDWVKQTMMSQGLIASLTKTAAEWEMEIAHLERLLEDAKGRVEKHQAGLAKAKSMKGVAQKQKWLDEAMGDVDKFDKEMAKAREQLKAMTAATEKKAKAESYAIDFEKEFQFMLEVAAKDLGKPTVLDSMKKAIERFEKGLEIPGPYQEPIVKPLAERSAGIGDWISGFLLKAWEYLKGAFDFFRDWIGDIEKATKDIEGVLKEAGAGE